MKIAFTADWHIHPFKEFSRTIPVVFNRKTRQFIEIPKEEMEIEQTTDFAYINTRLLDQYKTLKRMADICKKNGIKVLVVAGDVYHKRGNLPTETLYIANKAFENFTRLGISVYVLAGNHDQDSNSIKPLDNLSSVKQEGVFVSSVPEEIEIEDNIILRMIPYRHNRELLVKEFKKTVHKELTTILVSHIGISGAQIGNQVYASSDDFKVQDIDNKKYTFVALGHFHKPQNLTPNAFYCGSPYQMNFGEEGEDHGFYIGDTDTRELEFIPLESPKFITCTSYEQAKEESSKGNFIRLRCSSEEVVESNIPQNVRVERDKKFVQKEVNLSLSMSNKELISEYNRIKGSPEFEEVGLDILKSVIEGREQE